MITSICLSIALGICMSLQFMVKSPRGHNILDLRLCMFFLLCAILTTWHFLPLIIQYDAQASMLSAFITWACGFALDTTNPKTNHRFVLVISIITVIILVLGIIAPLLPKF